HHVESLKEQERDKGMQIVVFVFDDEGDEFIFRQRDNRRNEGPFPDNDLRFRRCRLRGRRGIEESQQTSDQERGSEDRRSHLALAKTRMGVPMKANSLRMRFSRYRR